MTEIVIIAAVAQNGAIGLGPGMPWSFKKDMKHFRELTGGSPCIMGDVTYRGLPPRFRPLPGRENIVCTLDESYRPEGTTVFADFAEAVAYARRSTHQRAFITGGATIYRLGLQLADAMELTRIHQDYQADTFFPEYDQQQWELINSEETVGLDRLSGEKVPLSFLSYRRARRGDEVMVLR